MGEGINMQRGVSSLWDYSHICLLCDGPQRDVGGPIPTPRDDGRQRRGQD
jgi:hypothetical protein